MVVNSFFYLYNIYKYILFNVFLVMLFERLYNNFIVNFQKSWFYME